MEVKSGLTELIGLEEEEGENKFGKADELLDFFSEGFAARLKEVTGPLLLLLLLLL